ncbi:MAG: hypothetical protein HYR60_33455, partial [Acidobacteria bacterium]|nr:hypothetical protein [Acidobacteriota bacterium]
MRIVILGAGGGMPAAAVETLAARHQVAGVVRPAEAAWRGWLRPAAVRAGLRPPDALGAITRRL